LLRWTAIWNYNSGSSVFTNLTQNVNTDTPFNFIATPTDTMYFGLNCRPIGIFCDLFAPGTYTNILAEYLSDSGWKSLQCIDNYLFNASKYMRWNVPPDMVKASFTNSNTYNTTPPDTSERYWIRFSSSGVVTPAVISKTRGIPFALYTTPEKVAKYMQLRTTFNSDSRPSDVMVEDLIRQSEDLIDYRTHKSWRFNAETSEEAQQVNVDFNRYGIFLRYRNFIEVYAVSIWNGSSFNKLTEGRTSDYFVDKNLGIVYFTRLFMLPATYGMNGGRYYQWAYGEFKNAVKVDYAYGRNWEVDREFYLVQRLTNKMVAKQLWENHDYSTFVISGTDKVPLESKIKDLDDDIERDLESLTGISIF
jgi:hypothetical protein